MRGALQGIRVVDASENIAAQYCARLMADAGADVLLVEPANGSITRRMEPFRDSGKLESYLFFHLNLGKRSIALDRSDARYGENLRHLTRDADIVLVSDDLDRSVLVKDNPQAIIAIVSDFGIDGPLAHWRGSEMIHQALSGMMLQNGEGSREPLYGCGQRSYYAAGVATFISIMGALIHRATSGVGQIVNIDVAEIATSLNCNLANEFNYNGYIQSRQRKVAMDLVFRCKDGWICSFLYTHIWEKFCTSLRIDHLANDARFRNPLKRLENWRALVSEIEQQNSDRTVDEISECLRANQCFASTCRDPLALRDSPHLASRKYWQTISIGGEDRLVLGPPYRLPKSPLEARGAAPNLNEHGASFENQPVPTGSVVNSAGKEPRKARPPLSGIRVLDLTTAWAGPMAARILAFLGAEVIHVESPDHMDLWRGGSHATDPNRYPDKDPGPRPYNRNVLFNSQNHNKKSLCLNLKHPDGAALARELAVKSDVVISNFKPGALDRVGLNYDSLAVFNPGIIVAEMPAFGLSGPMSPNGALGPTMEFECGMSHFIGYDDGKPFSTGPAIMDPIGGYNGAAAVMLALWYRTVSNEGQHVEVPQCEAAMPFIGELLLHAIETKESNAKKGNANVSWAVPHDAYPTRGEDQWIAIAISSDEEWKILCDLRNEESEIDGAEFSTAAGRRANMDVLNTALAKWTRMYEKNELAHLLQAHGIIAAPVLDSRDLANSEYLKARLAFTRLDHMEAGVHYYQSLPLHLVDSPGAQTSASPCLGQDTQALLNSILNLDDQAISNLQEDGAVYCYGPDF